MENATNALLIAGGVLIAIVIIAIGVTSYSLFASQSKNYSQIMADTELTKFNSKFEVYLGRDNISAQELMTVVNLSKEQGGIVSIYLKGTFGTINLTTSLTLPEDFISNNTIDDSGEQITFKCEYNNTEGNENPIYNNEGRINRLLFEKNS